MKRDEVADSLPLTGRNGLGGVVGQLAGRSEKLLLSTKEVASLLGVSTRHISRLAKSGAMPGRVHLGSLVRWDRGVIESWVAGGCQSEWREGG